VSAKNRSGLWPTGILGFMILNDNIKSLELMAKFPKYFFRLII